MIGQDHISLLLNTHMPTQSTKRTIMHGHVLTQQFATNQFIPIPISHNSFFNTSVVPSLFIVGMAREQKRKTSNGDQSIPLHFFCSYPIFLLCTRFLANQVWKVKEVDESLLHPSECRHLRAIQCHFQVLKNCPRCILQKRTHVFTHYTFAFKAH